MAVYSVVYTLHSPNQDYDKVNNSIKKQGDAKRVDETYWILATDKSPSEIASAIFPMVDDDDLVFIARLRKTGKHKNLPSEIVDWLNSRQF